MHDQNNENESRWPDEALTGFAEGDAEEDYMLYEPTLLPDGVALSGPMAMNEVDHLGARCLDLKVSADELADANDRKQRHINQLEGDIQKRNRQLESLRQQRHADLVRAQGEVKTANSIIAEHQQHIAELQAEASGGRRTIRDAFDGLGIDWPTGTFQDVIAHIRMLDVAQAEKQGELDVTEGDNAVITEHMLALNAHNRQLNDRIQQLEAERAANVERVADLERDLASAKDSHQRACEQLADVWHAATGITWGDGPQEGVLEDVVNERDRLLRRIDELEELEGGERIVELETANAGLVERCRDLAHANWKAQECLQRAFGATVTTS